MIDGVVYTALRGLVNDRCFPSRFPQDTNVPPEWPAIRYETFGANEATISGTDTSRTDDTRVLIDVVARTRGALLHLREQVIEALQDTDPPCYRDGDDFKTWNPDTKTFRCTLQYLFFASTPSSN